MPGSSLGEALTAYPVSTGGDELAIRPELFHHQFCADVPAAAAALMAATQRPVTGAALSEPLPAEVPAWRTTPSWFVFGEQDLNIPVELSRQMADLGCRPTRVRTPTEDGTSRQVRGYLTADIQAAADAIRQAEVINGDG